MTEIQSGAAPLDDETFHRSIAFQNPGSVEDALAYCHAFPDIVDARLCAAELLDTKDNLPAALEEAAAACALDEAAASAFRCYGNLLLKSGDFTNAEIQFASCLDLTPDDFDALIGMSSLLYRRGEHAGARVMLERCVSGYPLIGNAGGNGKPELLRVLGYEGSSFHIIRRPNGAYACAVHGGHFSPDDLLDMGEWGCTILNVLGGNTRTLDLPPNTSVVLNTISDPDRERSTLLELSLLLDCNPDIPVINPPVRVLETTRERNAARLSSIPGLRIAKTERLRWRSGDPVDAMREVQGLGFKFPVILRKTGSQTGDDTTLASSTEEMRQYFERADGSEHYVIQYYDLRREDGLFHKARVFFIDGRMYPVANLYHDGWSVHSGDRYSVMIDQEWTQEEEREFIANPERFLGLDACLTLARIAEIIRLDYFGIDFTICNDGRLFVFEANASMRHNFDHVAAFPYTRANLERISDAFQTMVKSRIGQ